MTRAKAKTLVSLLLDNDIAPRIRQVAANDYVVTAVTDGVPVAVVANVATNQAVAASVRVVDFS